MDVILLTQLLSYQIYQVTYEVADALYEQGQDYMTFIITKKLSLTEKSRFLKIKMWFLYSEKTYFNKKSLSVNQNIYKFIEHRSPVIQIIK